MKKYFYFLLFIKYKTLLTKENLFCVSKIFLFFIFLMSLIIVNGEEDKVFILNAYYDNGKISINDVTIKNGYFPDRKIPVETDYQINIYSKEKMMLYTKNIDVPLYIYTDVIVDGNIKGNMIKLNQTDFALVLPYYESAGKITISKNSEEKASYSLYPVFSFKNKNLIYYIVGALVFIVIVFLMIKNKLIQKPS